MLFAHEHFSFGMLRCLTGFEGQRARSLKYPMVWSLVIGLGFDSVYAGHKMQTPPTGSGPSNYPRQGMVDDRMVLREVAECFSP